MGTEALTEKERQMLEHLNHAKELGTPLTEFATAFHLNVNDLYAGKAQLQRKGFWPAKNVDAAKPELLVVQVSAPAPAAAESSIVCRLKAPSGLVIECGAWPEPTWMSRLMQTLAKEAS